MVSMRLCHFSQRRVGVLGIGRLVVFLFRHTSFYAKVEKDLTANNQKIVKDNIQNLTVKQELPATATNLIITTPRTSCIYFLP